MGIELDFETKAINNYGLVSVIIPTFDRANTIERSIRSVLEQTYDNLELIIIDDCSTDNTKEVIDSIEDNRIKYIRLDNNYGACVARNKGIDLANGVYIAFQDSDDVWSKEKLVSQLEILDKTGVDICSCRIRKHYIDDSREVYVFPSEDRCGFISHDRLCLDSFVSTQALIAKSSIFREVKFDPKVTISQDRDWIIRASKRYSLYITTEVLVDQFWQKDSISYRGSSKRITETYKYWLSKYEEDFIVNPSFKLHILKVLADHSTRLGNTETSGYYKAIYELERNTHNLLCYWLSLLKLMPMAKSFRHGGIAGSDILPLRGETIIGKNEIFLTDDAWWTGRVSRETTVCYVIHYSDKLAGSERSLLKLMKQIKENNIVPILVSSKDAPMMREAQKLGIKTATFPIKNYVMESEFVNPIRYLKYPIKRLYNKTVRRDIKEFIKNNHVDIIHINSTISLYEWAKAAVECNIPYIFHLREFLWEDYDVSFVGEKYCLNLIKSATERIAISKTVKEFWESKIGVKCRLIYNGVDADQYYNKREILSGELVQCVIVGRIHKNKGQMDAVRAIDELIRRGHQEIRLTIIGFMNDGAEYEREIIEYIDRNDLADYITLKEFSNNISDELKDKDIGLMCSKAEAFGRTTVEYALSGLIVVGADTAGTKELIEDMENGILFRQGNAENLAEKIAWIINNREEAMRIAEYSQDYFATNFSSAKNAKGIMKVYEEIAG